MVSLAAQLPYILSDLSLSVTQEELTNAAAIITDAFSMLLGGYLADRFGRKILGVFGSCASILGCVSTGYATSFVALFLLRLLTGVGNGISLLVIPMYVGECVSVASRGAIIAFFQLGVLGGTCFPYILISLFEDWRLSCSFGALPAFIVLFLFVFVFKESKSWSNTTQTLPPTHVQSASVPVGYLVLGILLAFANNSIDPCLFYGPEILIAMGNSRHASTYVSLGTNIVSCFAVMITITLMGKYSRRFIFLFCFGIVVLCFLVAALAFLLLPSGMIQTVAVVTSFGILVPVFQCGPGTLFIVIINELFTQSNKRGTYISICTFFMSFFSLVINGTLLTLIDWYGVAATFAGYGMAFLVTWLIFSSCLPETKYNKI